MKSKYQLFIRNVSFSLDCVPVNCYILSFIIYIKNIVTWPLNDIVFGEFCVCNFCQKQSIMWSNCQKSVRKKIDAEWQSSARFTFLRNRVHCVKCVQIRSFFWSVFFRIRTEYRNPNTGLNPYSVWIQEKTDQKILHIRILFTQW